MKAKIGYNYCMAKIVGVFIPEHISATVTLAIFADANWNTVADVCFKE